MRCFFRKKNSNSYYPPSQTCSLLLSSSLSWLPALRLSYAVPLCYQSEKNWLSSRLPVAKSSFALKKTWPATALPLAMTTTTVSTLEVAFRMMSKALTPLDLGTTVISISRLRFSTTGRWQVWYNHKGLRLRRWQLWFHEASWHLGRFQQWSQLFQMQQLNVFLCGMYLQHACYESLCW